MADPASITEFLQRLGIPWLVGRENGYADVTSYGTVLDNEVALTKLAIKARMPEYTPSDGLPLISADRGLVQGGSVAGPSESDSDFALRLREAWEVWPYAGTPLGILLQLYYSLGYDNVAIVQQNGLIYTLTTPPSATPIDDIVITEAMALETDEAPAPEARRGFPWFATDIPAGNPWWRFDDKTDFCSRFAVLFPDPIPASWTSIVNPPTTSSAPSLSEVNLIRKIINRWKNAEATCVGIYVQLTGLLWGFPADQVWGAGTGNWGGTSTVFSMTG